MKHKTKLKIKEGVYYPLGAVIRENGVNFSLYSRAAKEVFLLLFDSPDGDPTDIIRIECRTKNIWHVFVPGIKQGQLYGYRIKGDYNPACGLRFNEYKLLIDPYAKAITHKARNIDNLLLPYDPLSGKKDLIPDTRDNTRIVPKAIVMDDGFDWQNTVHPEIPYEKMIIYEVHVKGFTAHPSSVVKHPGTYPGFIDKIPYLKSLGINVVEFLPVHEFYVDDFLLQKGLTNYWGYNTICFFAPEISYSTQTTPGCQVPEFKTLVRELHKAGIEVIIDVVYNHTAEGNELGPMINLKGIDNQGYYTLTGPDDQRERYYMNYTGCGNSLNFMSNCTIRLVLDSLRYWVEVMHVDGFRFDLASVLGRESGGFRACASFFDAVSQDPVLNHIKLIAEPWDIGSYDVGNFPIDWSEWNGRFRDTIRKFGKGDAGMMQELGFRLTGSADLYGDDGRSPYNSINFITCHDGFTLNDLVSYKSKHNEANGENNRDGADDNNSWNWDCEGGTDDINIIRLRKKLIKNYFCMLLFSSGIPMILGGDEFMRTQMGNNNAYCQDNEISWFNWDFTQKNDDMIQFVNKLISFVRKYPVLQRRKFLIGKDMNGNNIPDISWFGIDATPPDWSNPDARTVCFLLDGSEERYGETGDYQLFFILNADYSSHRVKIPQLAGNKKWRRVLDTGFESGNNFSEAGNEKPLADQAIYPVNSRSVVVLLR